MVFKLKAVKVIDGYNDTTHFEVDYEIDENVVVGTYGTLGENNTFVGVYSSATCLKSDLVNYVSPEVNL